MEREREACGRQREGEREREDEAVSSALGSLTRGKRVPTYVAILLPIVDGRLLCHQLVDRQLSPLQMLNRHPDCTRINVSRTVPPRSVRCGGGDSPNAANSLLPL